MQDSITPQNQSEIDIQAALVQMTLNNNALILTMIDLFVEFRSTMTNESFSEIDKHVQELKVENLDLAKKLFVTLTK